MSPARSINNKRTHYGMWCLTVAYLVWDQADWMQILASRHKNLISVEESYFNVYGIVLNFL